MSELVEHEHLDGHYAVKQMMVLHPVNTVVSDYIEQLQARNSELEKAFKAQDVFTASRIKLISDQESKITKLQARIDELTAALERIANEYFTDLIEGEKEWRFLDQELTATKKHAQTALKGVSDE